MCVCVHCVVLEEQPLQSRVLGLWGLVGSRRVTAVIASRKRPVPFRTRKLRPTAPMVLQPGGCGRVGRRRTFFRVEASHRLVWGLPAFVGSFLSEALAAAPASTTGATHEWTQCSSSSSLCSSPSDSRRIRVTACSRRTARICVCSRSSSCSNSSGAAAGFWESGTARNASSRRGR